MLAKHFIPYLKYLGDDRTPPVITNCPADITVTTPVGSYSARVGWTEPEATDTSGNDLRITLRSNAPNSNFRVGTHTVTYTFNDELGNTASCHFDVTVIYAGEFGGLSLESTMRRAIILLLKDDCIEGL